MKLRANEKWLLLILFWFAVLFFYNMYVIDPAYKAIDRLNSEITQKKVELELTTQKLKALQLIRRETGELIIKGRDEVAIEFISYLTDNISKLKLNLVSMKPEYGERVIKQAKAMYFDFIVQGSYNQIYQLLIALEKFPNYTTVDFLRIKSVDKREALAAIRVTAYY